MAKAKLKDKASGGGNNNNNSNIIKDIAKAKILAIVAPFLGWLILIVIIIIIMLAPLSYAHMLMMKTFDDIQNGILKTGTNISNAMSDWFKSDDEAIKDSGEKYENYLTKRFMQLNKQMYNKDSHDISDKKDVAVNWVYGKIYKSYFDSSFMRNFISELPWKDAENTTYEFKDVSYSASNIYSPSKSLDVATARSLTFGDETNVYDIMAFDYVAGSLFDMLELDIVQLRNEVTQEKTNEVGEILGDKLKETYIGSSVELLNMLDKYSKESISKKINPTLNHLGIKSELSGGESVYKLLKIIDSKISNKNKYGIYKDDIALILEFGGNGNRAIANKYMELYTERGKIGTENYKYNEALLKEIEAGKKNDKNFKTDKKEKTEYLSYANKRQDELQEMAMEHISDLSKVVEYALETYQNLKVDEYLKINKNINWATMDKKKIEFLKNNDIKIFNLTDTLEDVLDNGYKKAFKKKDKLLKDTINTELENRIAKQVGELKLARTQLAAKSYKDYLTQTEVTNRIVYKVLDDSKIKELKEFKTLNKYKGVVIDDNLSVKLVKSGTYSNDIDSSIKKKTFLDANKRPIVSGVDSSSGVEYFQGYLSEYISAIKSSLVSAEENIESLSFYSNGAVNKDKILKSIKDESIKETLTEDDFAKIAKDLELKLDEKRKILSNVRVKLNELENGSLSASLLSDADISTVYPAGQAGRETDEYFLEGNNTLLIRKYNYTLEEAVKAVAQQHYGDILSRFAREDGTSLIGGSSVSIDVGGIEIGSATNTAKFGAGLKYFDIVEKHAKTHGLDPYLLYALMIQESAGNPKASNKYAIGLTQIHRNYSTNSSLGGRWRLFSKPINGPQKELIFTQEQLFDPDVNLEAGAAQLRGLMDNMSNNIYAAIVAYNMGEFGTRRIIAHYLGINNYSMSSPSKEHTQKVNEYLASGDSGWLQQRFNGYYNDEQVKHLEYVMSYYDTGGGSRMPWVIDRATGRVVTVGGEASLLPDDETGDDNVDENGEPKKIYHKNKELVLWKEYYTDNKTFELADKWSKKVNKDSLGENINISELFVDAITKESRDSEGVAVGLGMPLEKYENILAGAINRDNKFKLPIKGVVGEQAKQEVYKYVSNISKEIIDSLNLLSAKNYKFGLYRYSSTNKDIVDSELSNDYASFEEFLMEKRKNEGSSTMWLPIEAIEVAKILSGDIRVDAVDFYGTLSSEGNTSNKPAPVERFYKEWISAKAILHEIFNMMTDDDRKPNGERVHDELTIPNADGNSSDDTAKNPDLIGVLKLENKSGEPKEVSVNIIKKYLENNVDRNLKRKDSDIKYIVIHDTNLSKDSVYSHYNKKSDGSKSTMNYFVDSTEVTQFIEDEYPSNHLFDKKDATSSVVSNWNSIGIEMSGGNTSTFWNTVALTKYLMGKYSIPVENIVMHKDVTNADCSKYMQKETLKENMSNWDVFIDALKSKDITVEFESGDTATGTAAEIIEYAKTFIGLPYVWAGSGEIITRELIANFQRQWGPGQRYIVPDRFFDGKSRAFDCSGFTQYVYNHFGYSIGRTTENQKDTGRGVDLKDIAPGDLIILGPPNGPTTHVVMYIGNDEIIHAPQTGEFIRTESYSEYIKRNGNRVRTVRRYLD